MLKVIGSILLVSGITIGAAMLALPIATGTAGFYPSLTLFLACWLLMLLSAFITIEATLFFKKDTNLISMTKWTLGPIGLCINWFAYIFLLYAILTAYIEISGPFVAGFFKACFEREIPDWLGALPVVAIFGSFIYLGIRTIDRINRLLMLGLFLSCFILFAQISHHTNEAYLSRADWKALPTALPIIIAAFTFQIIIPSLVSYLNRDVRKLKWVVFIGSLIPLILYTIWEYLIIGLLPLQGIHSITHARELDLPVTLILQEIFKSHQKWIVFASHGVAFFAITTSLLGVALSLADFFADALQIKKKGYEKFGLCVLTLVPPFLLSTFIPRAFVRSLEYAGVFGIAILLILMPALMVWFGRYKKKFPCKYHVWGGKFTLLLAIVATFVIISLKIGTDLGLFQKLLKG